MTKSSIIKLAEIYKQIVNESGDLQNIKSYPYNKFGNKNYSFDVNEINTYVEVEFSNLKSLDDTEFKTTTQIYNDYMKPDDKSYNIGYDVGGDQYQFTKTNIGVYNRIMKTIVDIIQDFISNVKPYSLWIVGTSKNNILTNSQKNLIYYNISHHNMVPGYRIHDGSLNYEGATYDGYVIFQDRKKKIK
jgi:hypothetical protein